MTYAANSVLLHGACAVAYVALALLVTLRGRLSRTGLFLAGASLVTALWAGAGAATAVFPENFALARSVSAVETARIAAWALFSGHLLRQALSERRTIPRRVIAGPIAALALAGFAVDAWAEFAGAGAALAPNLMQAASLMQAERVIKILLCVSGILALENLYRNATPQSRWHINLLTIGIGAIFFYDIVLWSDAALFRRLSPALALARPPVDVLAAPLLAIGAVRNRRGLIDIHVSRNLVFHSSTFLISGVFLFAIGVVGEILRNIGVAWGPVLEITLVFGAVVLVSVVFTSGRARSKLRFFIAKNFFAYRYDYRKMWGGFIDTLSNPSFAGEQLRVRVIRAVADTVDSPAGSLWLRDGDDIAFSQVATWNLPRGGAPVGPEFADAFRGGDWIVDLTQPGDSAVPEMLAGTPRAWLAAPLSHLGRLLGFILLTEPRAAIRLNWENYELLRIVGRQVASYLAEEQAARALVEARQLQAYSQRFAFVVHDIKNLVSQLSLVLSNGERHAADPEFQQDVLETVRHSVGSMNKLLAQLRANREAEPVESVAPALIVDELVQAWRPKKPVRIRLRRDGLGENGAGRVQIGREQLDSALRHMLDNAVEVSPEGGEVTIDVRHAGGKVTIDVRDAGAGMAADFVVNELFRPFRSTKDEGYGIGAYQTRELIRAARGDVLVMSEPGKGTVMRIVLPALSSEASLLN
jgi:putative PEP-CTERM system histidine kinase